MKKKNFPLEKVLKYRAYLEKDQVARFRDAMNVESSIESTLTKHRQELQDKNKTKDALISVSSIDIKEIKSIQEQILFAQIDESVMGTQLRKASEKREIERLKWLARKGDADAIEKLREKFNDSEMKEQISEDQKEIDEIARQQYLVERKSK